MYLIPIMWIKIVNILVNIYEIKYILSNLVNKIMMNIRSKYHHLAHVGTETDIVYLT